MLFQDGIESVQVDLAFNVIGHVGSMMWAISSFRSAMIVMRSCCCCSTHNGAMIISILYLFLTGVSLIAISLVLYWEDYALKLFQTDSTALDGWHNFLLVIVAVQSCYFICCLLVLIGTVRRSAGCLLPWIVTDFFRQLVIFMSSLILVWYNAQLLTQSDWMVNLFIINIAINVAVIVLTFYFWLVVIGASQIFRRRIQPEDSTADDNS